MSNFNNEEIHDMKKAAFKPIKRNDWHHKLPANCTHRFLCVYYMSE